MTQLINYTDDGKVTFYATRPHLAGTPDFEHAVAVDVTTGKHNKQRDGSDDPTIIALPCNCGCGSVVYVPLTGDAEAQLFHSVHRLHTGKAKSLKEAIESVAKDVTALGHDVRVDHAEAIERAPNLRHL